MRLRGFGYLKRLRPGGENRSDGITEGNDVLAAAQASEDAAFQDIARALDVGGDYRHAGSHGLDQHQAEGFVARRHDEQVEPAQEVGRVGQPAAELDAVIELQFRTQVAQGVQLRPVAGDPQAEIDAPVA